MQFSSKDLGKNSSLSEALLSFAQNRHVKPGRIARLVRESESFREICADYEECCGKLRSLEQKNAAADRQLHDYLEMREQIERDLLRCLEEPAARRTNGKPPEEHATE